MLSSKSFLCCLILAFTFFLSSCNSGSSTSGGGGEKENKLDFDENIGCFRDGIVGGTAVDASNPRKKYLAMILNGDDLCTATLIDRRILLTAAHCIAKPSESTLVFFNHQITCSGGMNKKLIAIGDRTLIHPQWKGSVNGLNGLDEPTADLALIHLKQDAPETAEVAPLWKTENFNHNTRFYMMGYGKEYSEDERLLPKLNETWKKMNAMSLSNSIRMILFDQDDGHGACYGDSGGPVLMETQAGESKTGYVLMGVASAIEASKCENGTAYYTNVREYDQWISQSVKKLKGRERQ